MSTTARYVKNSCYDPLAIVYLCSKQLAHYRKRVRVGQVNSKTFHLTFSSRSPAANSLYEHINSVWALMGGELVPNTNQLSCELLHEISTNHTSLNKYIHDYNLKHINHNFLTAHALDDCGKSAL